MLERNTRAGRKFIISQRLRRRFKELNADADANCDDIDEEYDARFSWEKRRSEFAPGTQELGNVGENTKGWLEELALDEEKKASRLIAGMEEWVCEVYRKEMLQLQTTRPGMDTTVLERIRKGKSLQERAFEDLLAPLRVRKLVPGMQESQGDMVQVLLGWNERVTKHEENDQGRQNLILALEERIKTVDKVLAIVGDETNVDQFDRVGQSGILEPSQHRLLKAIHAYRPETSEFQNQDPFDMLVLMWAHVRNPDVATEDDCMYLLYKVLNGEEALKIRFEREGQRRVFQRKIEEAMRGGNQHGVSRLTKRWNAYNKKIAETARQHVISKIHCACDELKKLELDGLLTLSILQSAQHCAARDALPTGWTPPWTQILEECARVEGNLDDKVEKCFPDLEATSEVTTNQLREITAVHDTVFTRTLKFAGADLAGMDATAKERLIEARLTDPVTAGMMEQTLHGVLETQLVATQMLRHLGVMRESLGELLRAAEAKCEELEKLTLVADCGERGGY